MKHSQTILAFIAFCLCMPFFAAWGQDMSESPSNADIQKALEGTQNNTVFHHTERATEIGIGGVNRLDTYLSPQDYRGTEVRLIYNELHSTSNALDWERYHWDYQFTHEGAFDYTKNKVENAHTIAGHYDFAFSMMYRWDNLANGNLSLSLGGMADVYLGFAYNMRNSSNNPAQAYASLAIGGAGMAKYNLKLWGKTFPLRYEARLPLCGIMFSPAFGQSYYELFNEGNYDHNIVFTSIVTPSFRQQLSVDIPIGKENTYIRVGYLGDIRQAKPNHLRQHTYSSTFIIGLTHTINWSNILL